MEHSDFAQLEAAMRRALLDYEVSLREVRVASALIELSFALGRERAFVPEQRDLAHICALSEGDVSEAIEALLTKRIMRRVPGENLYELLTDPSGWQTACRHRSAAAKARAASTWKRLRWASANWPVAPGLFPPDPPDLDDALAEVAREATLSRVSHPQTQRPRSGLDTARSPQPADARGGGQTRPPAPDRPAPNLSESVRASLYGRTSHANPPLPVSESLTESSNCENSLSETLSLSGKTPSPVSETLTASRASASNKTSETSVSSVFQAKLTSDASEGDANPDVTCRSRRKADEADALAWSLEEAMGAETFAFWRASFWQEIIDEEPWAIREVLAELKCAQDLAKVRRRKPVRNVGGWLRWHVLSIIAERSKAQA